VAAITVLDESDIADLLDRYALGRLEAFWPAGGGIENTNYFFRVAQNGDSQEFVLTVLEQQPAAGALLVPLLDLCDDAGLPIAPIVRNRAGEAADCVVGKPALVAPRLIGRHVLNPTIRQCETVGRFLARFHVAAAPLASRAPQHPRDLGWLTTHFEGVRRLMPYGDMSLLDDVITSTRSLLKRTDVSTMPRGIIHGDLFRDNALFTERGLTGVIDFHHAAMGHLVYDIAVAANDWCSDSGGLLDRERTVAMLRAYHRVRALSQAELWFFPLFALYAAATFWLSRLTVALQRDRTRAVRFKNPDEFRHIVQQHRAHCLYVDPRWLD